MTIDNIQSFFFSPTGTTRKVIEAMCQGQSCEHKVTDLTTAALDKEAVVEQNSLTIVGVPVYAGRVAPVAAERLKSLKGSNGPAVVVVLYGNREYEDSLLELHDVMTERNFKVVGAAAFIGEHSFSTEALPIGHGRPDQDDLLAARQFGEKVMAGLHNTDAIAEGTIEIPGNVPYREGIKNFPFVPERDAERCTSCGMCVSVCPTGATVMSGEEPLITVDTCIFCCACVKNCPEDALAITAAPIMEKQVMLSKNCAEPKQPALFFSEGF